MLRLHLYYITKSGRFVKQKTEKNEEIRGKIKKSLFSQRKKAIFYVRKKYPIRQFALGYFLLLGLKTERKIRYALSAFFRHLVQT